jgi:hypothetical protein
MLGTRRRIRRALGRMRLSNAQSRLVRLLLREEDRERDSILKQLAECRLELRAALAPPAPDSGRVLELSRRERQLQERERALSGLLEARIASLIGPAKAAELRTLVPPSPLASEPAPGPGAPGLSTFAAPRLGV